MVFGQAVKIMKYTTKPGLSFSVTESLMGASGKYKALTKTVEGEKLTKALIGDTSLAIEKHLKNNFGDAFTDIEYAFAGSKSVKIVCGRPKSALSITTKLERNILKKGELNSLDEAIGYIGDGIGTRVILASVPKLSEGEILAQISRTTYKGQPLTNRQVNLLKKYIYEEPIAPEHREEAYQLFKKFAEPIVEKHTQESVDVLTMGLLASNIKRGNTTLEQIKKEGLLDERFIAEFERKLKSQDIVPLNITEFNNYRGAHGLSYFTDAQMRQLSYAQGLSPATSPIIGRSASASRFSYISETTPLEEAGYSYIEPAKSIKASGYNTCQMNIIHENGALGELQMRGEYINEFAEYEHLAYDLRQGKNTLGKVFDKYAEAVSKLPDSEYAIYNEYLESCYNYYHRLELGLPAKKPKLPAGLDSILSVDSMRALHIEGEAVARAEGFKFRPSFEEAETISLDKIA